MKASYGDSEVCPKCNGTGSVIYPTKGGNYSRPCTFTKFKSMGQLSLLPTETVKQAKNRMTPKKKGNRWHSKN